MLDGSGPAVEPGALVKPTPTAWAIGNAMIDIPAPTEDNPGATEKMQVVVCRIESSFGTQLIFLSAAEAHGIGSAMSTNAEMIEPTLKVGGLQIATLSDLSRLSAQHGGFGANGN